MSVFAVGAGGFGGKRTSDKAISTVDPPSRSPDASISEKTNPNQVREIICDALMVAFHF